MTMMKLNILIVLISLTLTVSAKLCEVDYVASHMNLTVSEQEKANTICEKCMKEYNVPLKSLLKTELRSRFSPSCSTKCYYKCYFQAYGSMDLDGNWVPSVVEGKMSEENYQAALECIGQSNSSDICEKAYKLYFCYVGLINKYNNNIY